jgi:hypothetical protein
MRVLLAHPPLNASREVTPPLGLCTLAAWLKHQGHQVRILDLDLEVKGLSNGQGVYRGLLARAIGDFSPRMVGITSMYNNSLQAERMARTVKECDPSIVTVGGGSHFGALGRHSLRRRHLPRYWRGWNPTHRSLRFPGSTIALPVACLATCRQG